MTNQKEENSINIESKYGSVNGAFFIVFSFIYIGFQLLLIYYFGYKSSFEWFDIFATIFFVFLGGLIIESDSKYLFKN